MSAALKYREKPRVVQALEWTGFNAAEMEELLGPEMVSLASVKVPQATLIIKAASGTLHAHVGNIVMKGVPYGDISICSKDYFSREYILEP